MLTINLLSREVSVFRNSSHLKTHNLSLENIETLKKLIKTDFYFDFDAERLNKFSKYFIGRTTYPELNFKIKLKSESEYILFAFMVKKI